MKETREIRKMIQCPRCAGQGEVEIVDNARLRKMRETAGMSLRELARRCGITAPYLCDIELGRRQPSGPVRYKLMKALL